MSTAPYISVIVPVHNAEAFLPACLASVAAQSFADFECLLAENGSTDGSAALCARFAAQDPRFRLLALGPGGVSAARAAGRRAARGAYLAFADADDLYHPAFLATLLHAAQQSGLPLAACRYDTFADTPPAEAPAPAGFSVLAAPAHQQALLHSHTVDYGLWNKLYRADLLPAAALDNGYRFNEDLLANWQAFAAAPGLAYCDFAGYHYRQHAASASHRPLSPESIAQQRAVAAAIRDAAAGTPAAPGADAFYYEKLAYLASMILRRRDAARFAAELGVLRAELKALGREPAYGKNPQVPGSIRAAAFAAAYCPGPYALACRALLRDRQ